MKTELCKNCGKPKEEHYYLELFNEWCCTPTEDIYNSDRFTPKKSNDSHSSQSGSKTNDKTSSENHSSFKTLKSSGSDNKELQKADEMFNNQQKSPRDCDVLTNGVSIIETELSSHSADTLRGKGDLK